MSGPARILLRHLRTILLPLIGLLGAGQAGAAPSLTITPITWNVIGLDSNNQATGPNQFPVGARVCNVGDQTAPNVTAKFVPGVPLWSGQTINPYISLLNGVSTLTLNNLPAGPTPPAPHLLTGTPANCFDFYFIVQVTRTALAFSSMTARGSTNTYPYTIEASASTPAGGTTATVSTPTRRELYVEKILSQGRNSVLSFTGPTTVMRGETYDYVLKADTSTNGYEQLETYPLFPNTIFQILNVRAEYTAPGGATNSTAYADACGWVNDPLSADYHNNRTCSLPDNYPGGKVGGTVTMYYRVKILSTGTAEVVNAILDFSGSSYHYNADFGSKILSITAVDPSADLTISKVGPASAVQGTQVSYTIKVWNQSGTAVSGATVRDTVPASLTGVSWSCAASGTASCGSVTSGSGNNVVLTLGALPINAVATPPTSGSYVTLTVTGTASTPGDVQNTASVSVPSGTSDSNSDNNSASATTAVSSNAPLACTTTFYALMGSGSTFTTIAALSSTGAKGSTIATLPGGTDNAALAVSPDGSRIFVGTSEGLLRVFDVTTRTWVAAVAIPGNIRTVRATVTQPTSANPNGVGYLSVGTSLYSFQTTAPYTVTGPVTITYTDTSGLTNPVPTVSGSGDFFADAQGDLYLSVNNAAPYLDLFRINLATGVASFITRVNDANIGNDTYGGYAALNGKVYGSSVTGRIIEVDLVNGTVTQTAAANSANANSDLASCSYPTIAFPDVTTSKAGPRFAHPSSTVTYTVSAINTTAAALSGVVLTDTLPVNTTFVGASGGGVYNSTSRTVTWTVGTLAANSTQSYTLTLTTPNAAVVAGGIQVITNVATISATNEIMANRSNNQASAQTQLVYTTLAKTVRNVNADARENGGTPRFSTNTGGHPGELLEYCITFSNPGGATLPNFVVSDDVPGNVTAFTTAYDDQTPTAQPGDGIRLTRGGTTAYLTSVGGDDMGTLTQSGGKFGRGVLTVNLGSLAPGENGRVCFQAKID